MTCSNCYNSFSGWWCDRCDTWPCDCTDDEPLNYGGLDRSFDEWNTLIWLLAEAQFRSSQCWPRCGGYCHRPKHHEGPCYW